MAKILLVEPDYKNKYPPLGLMKISTYHKTKGDTVIFCKGENKDLKNQKWDRIYITTLFTFYWEKTLDTIQYYYNSVNSPLDIYSGGVLATVLEDELKEATGITIKPGLLDRPGMLGNDDIIVDSLPPDYSIINPKQNEYLKYEYPTNDSYIAYATRGCIRTCAFCAVPKMEQCFKPYISIKEQVEYIKKEFGERRNLLLLDNNVLASDKFSDIIQDIIDLGFDKDAYFTYTKNNRKITVKRRVDFNQGIDARLLNDENFKLLSKIAIDPLRIAFDHADDKSVKLYTEKVRQAASYGIKNLSNYILFNFTDTPEDLYKRLQINVQLNEEFSAKGYSTRVWSFPMKYSPVNGDFCKNRSFIGQHWNKKFLRAIQCILIVTHGVVGPKKNFFEKAFGASPKEFRKILAMPENYIINRVKYEESGLTKEWEDKFNQLGETEPSFIEIIKDNSFKNINEKLGNSLFNSLIKHYI